MKFQVVLVLFLILPFCLSKEWLRRALSEAKEVPFSCFDMSDAACQDFSADAMPDTSTFDTGVAFQLVDYYCCALRKDSPKELYKVAIKFREFCKSAPYLEWQAHSQTGLSMSEKAIAQYCPNNISPEDFFNPSWANLWNIAILGHQSSAFLRCNGKERNGQVASKEGRLLNRVMPSESNGRITVTITGLEEDMWPHVWITLENDWTISWSSAHPMADLSNFDSVTGVEGRFKEGPKSDFDIPLDAPTWTIAGVNVAKLMDEKKHISSEPYDLIQNNCAHVALKLLSAGLGCEPTIVPFFSPASLINVMNNVVSKCNV